MGMLCFISFFSYLVCSLNTMTTSIILLFIFFETLTVITMSKFHPCYTESYMETLKLQDCLNAPMEIETSRCRGQCYSEDYLIYDWQSETTPHRHIRHIHCCSPNITIPRQIQVICNNKQRRIIKYPFVTQCKCKLCTDNCTD
jgi:hypothetical protein